MSDSDWSPKLAIGALVALVIFAGVALFEQSASLAPRDIAGPPNAEQGKQEADCSPNSERYYDCRDLIAQEGVRVATDAIVAQGERQFWLAVINLALLVGTFVASIIATFMAVEAVNVSREDYEGGSQPLLRLDFDEWNWDPSSRTYPSDDAKTGVRFINDGKGIAFIDVIWVKHFVFEYGEEAPPPVRPDRVTEFRWLPHGVVVQVGEKSYTVDCRARDSVSYDTFHALKRPVWVIQGFVFYRSITGGLYKTGFSYFWDDEDKTFYLGPVEGQESQKYNYARKVNVKRFASEQRERLFEAQQ